LLLRKKLLLIAPCRLRVEGHDFYSFAIKFKQLGRRMSGEGFVEFAISRVWPRVWLKDSFLLAGTAGGD
jgi:hypothetical protein